MISVQDLDFDYVSQRALSGVSFDLEPHRITALVGPNGSGKTTLMRCIAALAAPLNGRILVKGVDTVEFPRQVHRLCCYMPDLFGLYDQLSVWRCVEYAYASRAEDSWREHSQEQVDKILEWVGLTELRSSLAGRLSRGQRQRVALAQALVHDPEVVLLDEPASGLDPKARAELSELLLKLREQGKTLLVSSHILNELQEYSDRVLILEQGQVVSHQELSGLLDEARLEQRRLRVVLSEPCAGLSEWLEKSERVTDFSWEDAKRCIANFSFSGDLATQQDLLSQLVKADFPVVALEEPASLQQAYLGLLRRDAGVSQEGS